MACGHSREDAWDDGVDRFCGDCGERIESWVEGFGWMGEIPEGYVRTDDGYVGSEG